MPGDIAAPITFLNETGWREKEALTREWRHIDFSAGKVILDRDENKTEESRIFPFTETLKDLLKSQRLKADKLQRETQTICRYVFFCDIDGRPLFAGNPPRPIDYFRRSWESARKTAKIVATIHDFRRTAARWLIASGIDEQTAMKLLGHKTTAIFRRYRITTEQELFDAAKKLDAGKKGKVKGK
jgi:integrase